MISDILTDICTQTVFLARDSNTIHLWVLKGTDVCYEKQRIEDATSLMQKVFQLAFTILRSAIIRDSSNNSFLNAFEISNVVSFSNSPLFSALKATISFVYHPQKPVKYLRRF